MRLMQKREVNRFYAMKSLRICTSELIRNVETTDKWEKNHKIKR